MLRTFVRGHRDVQRHAAVCGREAVEELVANGILVAGAARPT